MGRKKKSVELPFFVPTFSSMHHSVVAELVLARRKTASIQLLNQCTNLNCKRLFLNGYTGLDMYFDEANAICFHNIKYYQNDLIYMLRYAKDVIKKMLDDAMYVYFLRIDDYYFPGKSYYRTKHIEHDGIISGYDNNDNSFTVIAYNTDWILKPFKISQDEFIEVVKKSIDSGLFPMIRGMRPKKIETKLDLNQILVGLKKYIEKQDISPDYFGFIKGNAVHDHFALYIDKLIDGSIPHDKMDWRPMRIIWEFRVRMLERIKAVESALMLDDSISMEYAPIVEEDDRLRMLYYMCTKKMRIPLLNTIKSGVKKAKNDEERLLNKLISKMEEKLK